MAKGTVIVRLRKDWFGPDGSLYQVRDNPHEFPAEYADEPKPLTDEQKEAGLHQSKGQKYAVLPSSAEIVDGGRVVVTHHLTGSGAKLEVPEAVDDDVKSVGGALNEDGREEPTQTVAKAAAAAKELGHDQIGGKPRESGPLPAGAKK